MCYEHEKIEKKIIMKLYPSEDVPSNFFYKKGKEKKFREFTYVRFHGNSLKKPRQHSWEHGEIIALIEANREKHLVTFDQLDPWDQF